MPAPTAERLAEALRPLIEAPGRGGIFLDVDGTLAPIVERAESALVPQRTSRLIATLARCYRCVACISGRSAAEARRLVGVGAIAYAGAHGAELLEPSAARATVLPEFGRWSDRVRAFVAAQDASELHLLRVRLEDKGPITAFHWRGAPDEETARLRLEHVAQDAEDAGLSTHWGRKVLEVRPPVRVDKGRAVRELVGRFGPRTALYAGDDVTDLDAFDALDGLVASGELEGAVRVGLASEEGPAAIIARADVVVEGTTGFEAVLEALAAV